VHLVIFSKYFLPDHYFSYDNNMNSCFSQ